MCGIAGILNFKKKPVSQAELKLMTDAIAHRGPDGEGQFVDRYMGLGHRRLSIIDLSSAGNQPMTTANGQLVLSYNGELYNFRELRRELESLGHEFVSRTDSEVILNSYAEWGTSCLDKFNGMFAFAIWDKLREELFLARDRYGVKPLYYTVQDNNFLFASEVKGLLTHPSTHNEIDLEAVLEYFTFQNLFTDKTFHSGIQLFPPGCFSIINLATKSAGIKLNRYWDYCFEEPSRPAKDQEYLEELDALFKQAVTRQLVSDVEVGSYLSGGMDSGAITATAANHLPYLKTFTCGFDLSSATGLELGFDERAKSERMSYLFKTEHYEVILKAGDMERVMSKLVWHLEEPRVGQSYPNFYVAQLAGKFVKVALSGMGGDEIFGGYPWRYYRAVVNDNFEDYIDKYYLYWQRLIPNQLIKEVFKPIWKEVRHVWTRDIFRDVLKDRFSAINKSEDYVAHSLYFEAKTFLHGLLTIEDKISMAHGLETRVPFLDNDLVDFAMKLPVHLRLGNLQEVVRLNENEPGPKTEKYFHKTRDGKLLLRKMMERYIPESVTKNVKQGFSAPDASWFKGDSMDYVRQLLFDKNAVIYNYLDRKTCQGLVTEHLEGKANRRLLIWSLLNFEHWCKNYSIEPSLTHP